VDESKNQYLGLNTALPVIAHAYGYFLTIESLDIGDYSPGQISDIGSLGLDSLLLNVTPHANT